jgi:hypothetical protein
MKPLTVLVFQKPVELTLLRLIMDCVPPSSTSLVTCITGVCDLTQLVFETGPH